MNITESDHLIETFIQPTSRNKTLHAGMPRLEKRLRPVSFFEFWPGFIIYLPVVLQALWLVIRYRGLSLPLISNPGIYLSGMVGESKEDIFSMAEGKAKSLIPCWFVLSEWNSEDDAEHQVQRLMQKKQLELSTGRQARYWLPGSRSTHCSITGGIESVYRCISPNGKDHFPATGALRGGSWHLLHSIPHREER